LVVESDLVAAVQQRLIAQLDRPEQPQMVAQRSLARTVTVSTHPRRTDPMYDATTARQRFSAGTLEGASGPRIIVMCFDRLDRDLAGAHAAIEGHDYFETNSLLGHAQDLLTEMAMMLDTGAWEHGGSLLAIYDYLLRLLAVANAKKDAAMVQEAQRYVTEIGDAFRAAERGLVAAPAPTIATPEPDAAAPRRISVQA
jgi:flagellar biosynthetic protein FliS